MCMCVCACACVCGRACVRTSMCVCARACVETLGISFPDPKGKSMATTAKANYSGQLE